MTSTLNLGSKIPISELEGDITDSSGLTGFLDDDLTKLSQTGKERLTRCCAPDFSKKVTISYNAGTTTGTFSENGWFYAKLACHTPNSSQYNAYVYVNDIDVNGVSTGTSTENNNIFVKVCKGDTYKLVIPVKDSYQYSSFYFYPDRTDEEDA